MELTKEQALTMLQVVADAEKIDAYISIIDGCVSVYSKDFPEFGRQEFRDDHLRKAAWDASLWICNMRNKRMEMKQQAERSAS